MPSYNDALRASLFALADVLNVFMCTGFTRDTHQYFMKVRALGGTRPPAAPTRIAAHCTPIIITSLVTMSGLMQASPVRPGDFIEFFAEIDLLAALSACPGGDCRASHSDDATECFPLRVEIFDTAQGALDGWSPPGAAPYSGDHGFAAFGLA